MASRYLLCLLLLCVALNAVNGKWGGRSSSRSSSRGSSSGRSSGWGWGSSSGRSSSSSSSGSSWRKPSSSSSSHSYPSSWSGLSGSSSGHSYPSSSSGLSGSGSSSHSYPSSSSGLSGRGTYNYPTSIGLSGFDTNNHNKPSTVLSGSYPKSKSSSSTGDSSSNIFGSGTTDWLDSLGSTFSMKNAPSDRMSGLGFNDNYKKILDAFDISSGKKNPSSSTLFGSRSNNKADRFGTSTSSNYLRHSELSEIGYDYKKVLDAISNLKLPSISESPSIGLNNNHKSLFIPSDSAKYPWSSGTFGSSATSGIKYPASTGLSGSNSGSRYPASTGLSGSSSGIKYPASTGLSGSSSGSKYPASTGLSGSSSGSKYPASTGISGSNIGGNSYHIPPSTSFSGSANTYHKPEYNYHPSNTYHSNSGYRPNSYGNPTHGNSYGNNIHIPTYYTSPQHVYITEYRNSGSRYNDLLTGLTLYNLGRSHTHYHDHYYYDDYYRQRYSSGSRSNYHPSVQPKDNAYCLLRIKEHNKIEELKIPCEIVSTFTEGSKKVAKQSSQIESTVCHNSTTIITENTTSPVIGTPSLNISTITATTESRPGLSVLPIVTNLTNNQTIVKENITLSSTDAPTNNVTFVPPLNTTVIEQNITTPTSFLQNNSISNETTTTMKSLTNTTVPVSNTTFTEPTTFAANLSTIKPSVINATVSTPNTTHSNVTQTKETKMTNATCVVTSQLKDPLSLKGPPPDPNNMECEVEIVTNNHRLKSKVNCLTLMEYAKMPEPKKDAGIVPDREKLKSWLAKPPWWLSMFIAV